MKTNDNEAIICALDFKDPREAKNLVEELGDMVRIYKVGMLLQFNGGLDIISWLLERNKKVFLDMKYYDIPETVGSVVQEVARKGIHFLTVHGNSKIIQHAMQAKGNSPLKLLAVTLLTSMDAEDLQELGVSCSVEDLVFNRVQKALDYGCEGVIASGREAEIIRNKFGNNIIIITPGIRPSGQVIHEHKRAVTPREAVNSGADYLVVGRPIYQSSDPRKVVQEIKSEIN